MRSMVVLAMLALAVAGASAQSVPGGYDAETAWFGGPAVGLTKMQGARSTLLGGVAGIILQHRYAIGLAGYGLCSSIYGEGSTPETQREIGLGFGGIYLADIITPDAFIHPILHLLIGGGAVAYHGGVREVEGMAAKAIDPATDVVIEVDPKLDAFFLLQPGFGLEVSATRNIRIEASIDYRMVSGVTQDGLSDTRLSGAVGGLAVKFVGFY